jgi:TRAP-type uncharacterized transport system fused permease subunit
MALALAPFLEELGYSRVASHMFVFYYSIFATIIPPVAITAMAAAQLAGASFMETSLRAMKLAFVGLVVPYVFIFNTTLLEFPNFSLAQGASFLACVAGLVALSAAWWGWLGKLLWPGPRALIGAAGVGLLVWAAIPP